VSGGNHNGGRFEGEQGFVNAGFQLRVFGEQLA
jgi:hypothetical protein